MEVSFIPVAKEHITALTEIYNGYVRTSTATFHYEPRTEAEMADMLLLRDPEYLSESWVVLAEGDIAGYVYFAPYKKREAYRCSSEVTLYLKEAHVGKGIGTQALGMMETRARQCGMHTLLSVICGENEGSIRLFEKCGYEKCAHLKQVGRKFDRLLDVVMYQKML